jgi:hypothetical protein
MRKTIAAVAAAALLAAGLATAAPAIAATRGSPASQTAITPDSQAPGSPQDQIWCLTSRGVSCLAFNPYDAAEAVSSVVVAVVAVWTLILQTKAKNGDKRAESKDEGSDTGGDKQEAGLCLTDTGGTAWFGPCGGNGTVWILEPHGSGWYMQSQYMLNRGANMVLSVGGAGYTELFLDPPDPGGPFYQAFSWVPPVACCTTAAADRRGDHALAA